MNYVIGTNIAGYLPEDSLSLADTFKEAKEILLERLDQLWEEEGVDLGELDTIINDVSGWVEPSWHSLTCRSGQLEVWIVKKELS